MTEFYMIEGTHLFNAIGAALTDRMKIFRFRAELFYPGIFGGSSELSEEPFDIEMRGLSRPDFLKTCFENKPRGIRD